jgi:LEA14-like dessication related protein
MFFKLCVLFLISGFIFVLGCATVQQFIQTPKVAFENLSLRDASLFESTLLFQFNVDNPNPIGATIRRIAYDLKIQQRDFASGTLEEGIKLKAGGTERVTVPVRMKYLEVFESIVEFVQSNRVAYELSGSFSVGPFDIPYRHRGNLDIPKLPDISLDDVRISALSATGATLTFSLNMTNSNSFPVQLNGLDYGIQLGGIEFADGRMRDVSTLNKRGDTRVDIPVNISFFNLGHSAYRLLTGTSSDFDLTGAMQFKVPAKGIENFPFRKTGTVKLTR